MEERGHLAVYLVSLVLFGTNGIVASAISMPSGQIVLLRTFLGTVLLVSVFLLARQRLTFVRDRRQAACLVLSGFCMGGCWLFMYGAYREIGVGTASLFYCCGPAIVMALSPLFGERLTPSRIAGFAVVMAGAFMLSVHGAGGDVSALGLFYGIMTAVLYAGMIAFNKMAPDVRGLENSSMQMLFSLALVAAVVPFTDGLPASVPGPDVVPVLVLGFVNTGVGCLLYFSSIKWLPAQTVAMCDYLEPMSAVVLAALVLGESMDAVQAAGAVLIVGGAVASQLRSGGRPSDGGGRGPPPAVKRP